MSGSGHSPHGAPALSPRVFGLTPGAGGSDCSDSRGERAGSGPVIGCLSFNTSRYADVRSFSATARLGSTGLDDVLESAVPSSVLSIVPLVRSVPFGSNEYGVGNDEERRVSGIVTPYARSCIKAARGGTSLQNGLPNDRLDHYKSVGAEGGANADAFGNVASRDLSQTPCKGDSNNNLYNAINSGSYNATCHTSPQTNILHFSGNTVVNKTTTDVRACGYGRSDKQRAIADPRGATHGGSLSRELDLELVRLEILVDSLEEMEEQIMLNEDDGCDNVSDYHSSEDGDLSSANEMKQGMERSRVPRTAIPQYLRASPAPHQQQQQQPPYHHQHQLQQHRTEHSRTPGVGSEDRGQGHPATRQERAAVTPYATGLCPPPSSIPPSSPHTTDLPPRTPSDGVRDGQMTQVTCRQQYVTIQEHDRIQQQYYLQQQLQQQQQQQPQQRPQHGVYTSATPTVNGLPDGCVAVSERLDVQHPYRHAISASNSSASPASSSSFITATATTTATTSVAPPSSSSSSSVAVQDYPIRGTMSPLTSHVGGSVRRGGGAGGGAGGDGDGGELSFVFGRPATPDAAVIGRCASPPLSLSGTKRPLSPSSRDCLPIRRTASASGPVVEREVLSPPPTSSLSSWGEGRMLQGGVCCEHCNGCLIELKRQALRLMFPDNGSGACLAQSVRLEALEERLAVPDALRQRYATGRCHVCETQVAQLKGEAIAMIRSIQLAQSAATSLTSASIPALVGSCSINPQQHRYGRQGKTTYAPPSHASLPLAAQAQAYLEHNVRAWMNPKKYNQMLAARAAGHAERLHTGDGVMAVSPDLGPRTHPHPSTPQVHPSTQGRPPLPGGMYHSTSGLSTCSLPSSPPPSHHVPSRGVSPGPSSTSSASSPPPNSAAVSFFHRAAQKLSKKKKRQQSQEPEPPSYPTSYGQIVRLTPPPAPPCLLRAVGRLQNPGVGKVKVMLKICNPSQVDTGARFLSVDPHRKQVTIFDPSASGYVTSANRRTGIAAPKMFAFDAVFSPDDSLTEMCAASLSEIVQAVVSGADGCLFTYGYSRTGKTYTMLGTDQSGLTLGVMPCAISWLFKLIGEQKDKTGARFSVRVSAVEVTGKNEVLRDLLVDIAHGTEATGVGTAPGVYLREDPICGTQLENQSELRAPTADKAALYLDAALAARSATDEDEARCSHLLFTLNVYQYRIEKANRAGLPGVAGGRSRLHLIDLGNASKSRDPNNVSLSLSALGNVIMALLNGQRHVPHRDSKISQLLRDSLGNVTCRTCMLAHVSSAVPHYNETLQVIQLAARIHRMKRRRTKFSSTSSEDSSTDESAKFRRPYRGLRMGTLREDVLYSSSHSDPDYTSSSEQSCDTVIYLGANGQSLSDRELTDNEGPPRHVPRTNPRLPRRPSGSRSSGDDSDSGRSRASEGRYAIPPHRGLDGRLPMRAGTPVQGGSPTAVARVQPVPHVMSAPGSPNPNHVKTAHRMNLQGKGAVPKAASTAESPAHWQDKAPKQHGHRVKAAEHAPIQGEQWVDGPGAAIYPEAKQTAEQWVDGPSAFVVQSEPPPQPQAPQSPSHRGDTARRMKNRKVDAEEQWVDGPREMMASASGSAPNGSAPLHTSTKAESCKTGGQSAQAAKLSLAVSDKALKQALIKHLERERPESTISVTSNVSTTAEAADSRPTSVVSSGESSKMVEAASKSSARDWADKRHAGDGVSMVDPQELESRDVHSEMYSESPSPSHHRKHHKDHLGKKLHASLASPKNSPKASPACSRKGATDSAKVARLQKSDLPGSASPTHRVAQWIKSVSSSDAHPSSTGDGLHMISETTATSDVVMADAETNTEHDSDFERMADLENSPPPQCGDDVDTGNVADASLDSSVEAQERGSEGRRESLYELNVEEQLENLKSRKDSSLLAKDVDDETFSSLSCSAREADDTDKEESVLVTNSKVLTEGRQSAKLARHLAAQESHESSSSCAVVCEATVLPDHSKPLLSRKPDGASNPHLNREFCEEDAVSKDHVRLAGGETCVGAHYASVCHSNDSADVYAAPQGLYNKDGLGLCDGGDAQSPTLSGKGSKLAIRSKPPLPQKPSSSSSASSSPKATGLSKASCVSSSCSSSGPSAGSSATSTPKSVSSKDSPLAHKQTSPKGSAVPVFSTPHAGRKEKDKGGKNTKEKNSTSSSSLNSSPASVGKNGAQKANGKSQNSKLPLFSSRGSPVAATKDSKLRKKDKESGKNGRCVNGKYVEVNSNSHHHHKPRSGNNDSDSGNDSGIVAHEKKLLSPYATVTKPRTPSHSSSGHGSDNSSTISTEVHSQPSSKGDKLHGGTSSGYESMLRESEGTASSDEPEESGSENSDRKKGTKRKGTKRCRSAPARSSESPGSNGGGSNGGRTWVETRHAHKAKDEPLELKKYDVDDVERLQRRRQDEAEGRVGERSRERGKESNGKQPVSDDGSKPEIIDAKDRISIERSGWGFDCKFLMCFCKSRNTRGTDV